MRSLILNIFNHETNLVLDFSIEIRLDPHHGRMTSSGKKTININPTVSSAEECRQFEVNVQYIAQFIFRPVTFDMHFDVLDRIPDSEGIIIMYFS